MIFSILLALFYHLNFSEFWLVSETPVHFDTFFGDRPDHSGSYDGHDIHIYLGGFSYQRGFESWVPFALRDTLPHEIGHVVYQSERSPDTDSSIINSFPTSSDYPSLSRKFGDAAYSENLDLPAEIFASRFQSNHIPRIVYPILNLSI